MKTWTDVLAVEKQESYFRDTLSYVNERRAAGVTVFPSKGDVFNAFKSTPLEELKVVILGQDPYHGPGQAHGLCFSVKPGVPAPPSLVNMYKELCSDIVGFERPDHGYLQAWAEQGVLLLNTVLTVEQGKAHSHKHLGWETFTDRVVQAISDHTDGTIFLLWGAHAQKKGARINTEKHHVLKAPHPSPLSAHRGFLGCGHFSKTNELLKKEGKSVINWGL